MDVQVRQQKRQPRPGARFSLLGDGLLERTRSTTFALLGLTAAVGLALIAVVLQGDWPLIAGSPIPQAPVVRESVGAAAALDAPAAPPVAQRAAARRQPTAPSHGTGSDRHAGGVPAAPAELVSSPATPTDPPASSPHSGGSHGPAAPHGQTPSAPQSQPTSAAPDSPPSSAPAAGRPSSPPPTEPAPQEATPPEATASESNVPPWSNGKGHAYGRAEDHGPE
jgi:hypothetical protein